MAKSSKRSVAPKPTQVRGCSGQSSFYGECNVSTTQNCLLLLIMEGFCCSIVMSWVASDHYTLTRRSGNFWAVC